MCKKFFPTVKERMKKEITMTAELTAMITGHGKTRADLHQFRIIDDPTCSCLQEVQTVEHLIYTCVKLNQQRDKLKCEIYNKLDRWPVSLNRLVMKHHKEFKKYIKLIEFSII